MLDWVSASNGLASFHGSPVAQRIIPFEGFPATIRRLVRRQYGKPKTVQIDKGPQVIGKNLGVWAYMNDVTLDFNRPSEPTNIAFAKSRHHGLVKKRRDGEK